MMDVCLKARCQGTLRRALSLCESPHGLRKNIQHVLALTYKPGSFISGGLAWFRSPPGRTYDILTVDAWETTSCHLADALLLITWPDLLWSIWISSWPVFFPSPAFSLVFLCSHRGSEHRSVICQRRHKWRFFMNSLGLHRFKGDRTRRRVSASSWRFQSLLWKELAIYRNITEIFQV